MLLLYLLPAASTGCYFCCFLNFLIAFGIRLGQNLGQNLGLNLFAASPAEESGGAADDDAGAGLENKTGTSPVTLCSHLAGFVFDFCRTTWLSIVLKRFAILSLYFGSSSAVSSRGQSPLLALQLATQAKTRSASVCLIAPFGCIDNSLLIKILFWIKMFGIGLVFCMSSPYLMKSG